MTRRRAIWPTATSGARDVDQILADEQVSSPSSAGETLWTLTDHLNSVRDAVTYDSGADTTTVRIHRVYDAYGNVVSEQLRNAANQIVQPGDPGALLELLGFTARPLDMNTGLQNNLNRWYDAEVGKWLSEDPIGV
jgi:RHS repeat-associated protein